MADNTAITPAEQEILNQVALDFQGGVTSTLKNMIAVKGAPTDAIIAEYEELRAPQNLREGVIVKANVGDERAWLTVEEIGTGDLFEMGISSDKAVPGRYVRFWHMPNGALYPVGNQNGEYSDQVHFQVIAPNGMSRVDANQSYSKEKWIELKSAGYNAIEVEFELAARAKETQAMKAALTMAKDSTQTEEVIDAQEVDRLLARLGRKRKAAATVSGN